MVKSFKKLFLLVDHTQHISKKSETPTPKAIISGKKKNDVPRIWDLVCYQTPWSKMQCPSEEVAGYVLVW